MLQQIRSFVPGTPGAKLLQFSIALYFVICGAVTFLHQTALDSYLPVGQSTIFRVDSIAPNVSKAQATDALISITEDARRNIYRMMPDPENPDSGRILFGFIGDRASSIEALNDGKYPSFNPSSNTELQPWTSLGERDMRGMYASNFSSSEARDLISNLRDRGIEATLGPRFDTLAMASILFGPPTLGPAVLVALAGLLVSTAFYGAKRLHVIAVGAAHGVPFGKSLLEEAAICLRVFVFVYGSLLAAGVALLFLYNGLNQGAAVVATACGLSLIGVAAAVAILLLLFLACRKWSVPQVLKGRAPLRVLISGAALAQLVGLAVAFPSVSTLAGSIDRIQRDADLDDQWLKARGLVTTRFGGSNTPADFIAAAPLLGELARAEDRAGRLVVAWPFSLTPSDSLEIQRTTDLVVNPQYLERQHVVDEEGLRIRGPLPSDTVLLLIPASQKTQKEQIESRAVQWLELQREVQKSSKAMPVVKSVIVKSGQELFTYHAASRASDSTQIDPIVLVASPDSTALSDDFLVSAASSGGLLFSGGGKLSSLTVSTGLDKYLTSIDSVSDLALEERARRLAEVQMKAGELTLIVAVLIALTLVLSAAYCERQRRRLFLERVHGRSFIRRHLVFLGAVAGGALAVLGACVLLRAAESILGLAACAVLIAVLLPTAVIALARNDRVVTSRVPE